jgi:hypothetical protein
LPEDRRAALSAALEAARVDISLLRGLNASDRMRRMRAASYLPLISTRAARINLIHAMERETSRSVKLFLAAALTELGEPLTIPTLIDSLAEEPLAYQRSLWGLLSEFGESLAALLPILRIRPEKEIQLLLIHFAGRYRSAELEQYLLSRVDSQDLDISHAAFRALWAAYPASVDHARFLAHDDYLIRNLAAESLGSMPTVRSLSLLFSHLEDPLIRRSVVLAVVAILRARPQHFRSVMLRCLNEKREAAHATLLDVLANYVDYLAEKLLSADSPIVTEILMEIIRHGHARQIINFLNRNRNTDIEAQALRILKALIRKHGLPTAEFSRYLDPRLLPPLGLKPLETAPARAEHSNLPLLATFLALGVALIPALCLLASLFAPGAMPETAGSGLGTRFLGFFNAAFAVYAAALNGSYLLLLLFRSLARAASQPSAIFFGFPSFSRSRYCPRFPLSVPPSTRKRRSWRASVRC